MLNGWEVQRGRTKVTLGNGVTGVITEWYGGHFTLDNGINGHRDDIVQVHVDHGAEPSDDISQYLPDNTKLPFHAGGENMQGTYVLYNANHSIFYKDSSIGIVATTTDFEKAPRLTKQTAAKLAERWKSFEPIPIDSFIASIEKYTIKHEYHCICCERKVKEHVIYFDREPSKSSYAWEFLCEQCQ